MGSEARVGTAEQLAAFLELELGTAARAGSIEHDDDLLALGVLDSAGMAQLIAFVQVSFGIDVDDDDLVVANFESISAIARLVDAKTAAAEGGRAI
jgi:methoxymalonate biosynthesis acyl carrier protein